MRVWTNYGSGTDLVGHLRKSRQSCSPVISLPAVLRTRLGSTMQSIIAPYMSLSTRYLRSLATLRVIFTFGRPNRPHFFLTFFDHTAILSRPHLRFSVSKEKTFERVAIPPNKLHFTDSTFHAASAGLFRIDFCRVVVEISIGVFFAVGTKE